MAIPKVCGIETEYGVTLRGAADPNPVLASSMLINGYVEHHKVGWDFEDESPGATPTVRPRGRAPPEIETHLVNTVLTNGARYYVDHAHPEYSTPECADALELVCADKAGERILARSMLAARRLVDPGQEIVVYKNNSDGKGNSYGTHENYLVDRAVPFAPGAQPAAVVREPPGLHRRGQGRLRERRRRGRLPDQPAGRLLRRGGRPRDHVEAAHRQHARRAARRPAAVPAPARHRRRRQPV